MRTRTATWYECKVRYDQTQMDGNKKAVTEQYVVDALSFAEAEKRITEEMIPYFSGEFEVTDLKKAAFREIFFMDELEKADEVFHRPLDRQSNTDTRYYKAKVQFITIDESTGKEKRSNVTYLVEATSLHNALGNIDEVMKGTMLDYVQASVQDTAIIEVFEYQVKQP